MESPELDPEGKFRALFETHFGAVTAYAHRRCTDPADADDVVAETFTVAWRRMDAVPAEPLPWLYGVARRVLANQRRGRKRWLGLLDRIRREPLDLVTPHGDGEPVRMALARLKPADQELLRLAAWEDLSHSEIGDVLGISANAAGIRVHRARKQLAAELSAIGYPERKPAAPAGHSAR